MGISIPEEKITDALITAYMKHRRGPEGDLIWQEHFQALADMLIKHGIVSPPVKGIVIDHSNPTAFPLEWIVIDHSSPATFPPENERVVVRLKGGGRDFCEGKVMPNYTHWRPI